MYLNYKKLLPAVMRTTRWGQLVDAYQSLVENEIKPNKIKPIKNQYTFENMTTAEKINMCSILGYNLLQYDGYTSSTAYLNKQVSTIGQRILWKNTETGYKYLYYLYNAQGYAWAMYLDQVNNYYQPIDEWNTLEDQGYILTLDPSTPTTLDSSKFLTLDQDTVVPIRMRFIILGIEFLQTENTTEFLSTYSLKTFKNDAFQMKRATERLIYEPYLYIEANRDHSVNSISYTTYDSLSTTNIDSILISGSTLTYSEISSIQFGTGSHTFVSGSILSGVSELSFTLANSALQEIVDDSSTNIHLRRKIMHYNSGCTEFKELSVHTISGCVLYSKFPLIKYPDDMTGNFRIEFVLV